jgi:hypothetical protein
LLLSIAAAMSLIFAAILSCGYISRMGPLARFYGTPGPPALPTIEYSPNLESGRVVFWRTTWPEPTAIQLRWIIEWHARQKLPDVKRPLWEFDAHKVSANTLGYYSSLYIFAFPIWCVLLPCLIAPIFWLRNRRIARDQIGFTVITQSAEEPGPAGRR